MKKVAFGFIALVFSIGLAWADYQYNSSKCRNINGGLPYLDGSQLCSAWDEGILVAWLCPTKMVVPNDPRSLCGDGPLVCDAQNVDPGAAIVSDVVCGATKDQCDMQEPVVDGAYPFDRCRAH